jgi:hypothetical protein
MFLQHLTYYWVSFDGLEPEPALYETVDQIGTNAPRTSLKVWRTIGATQPIPDSDDVTVYAEVARGPELLRIGGKFDYKETSKLKRPGHRARVRTAAKGG